MRKKEIILGFLFALVITIFINYGSIERLTAMSDVNIDTLIMHLYYPLAWSIFVSMLLYSFFTYSFKLLGKNHNIYLLVAVIVLGSFLICYLLGEISPWIRDMFISPPDEMPEGRRERAFGRREMNVLISRHILIAVLNLLFVYILRLSYVNQEIRLRNEHLQFEKVRAQHNALIQQINPHFFFNSLNGLSYYISTKDTDEALSYLNNLTAVFRQILKSSDKEIYSLKEEIEFIKSYVYMLQKRFEGKLFVSFEIDDSYGDLLLPRFALLPLIENVIKHNTISSRSPISLRVYTSDDGEIVVENNISPKLEAVESTGIGLSNLDAQYKLLMDKNIKITRTNGLFVVALPLAGGDA